MAGMASVSTASPKVGSGKLSSITIEPSDNGGFTVRASHKPTKSRTMSDGPSPPWPEPKTLTFEDADSMMKAVSKLVGSTEESDE